MTFYLLPKRLCVCVISIYNLVYNLVCNPPPLFHIHSMSTTSSGGAAARPVEPTKPSTNLNDYGCFGANESRERAWFWYKLNQAQYERDMRAWTTNNPTPAELERRARGAERTLAMEKAAAVKAAADKVVAAQEIADYLAAERDARNAKYKLMEQIDYIDPDDEDGDDEDGDDDDEDSDDEDSDDTDIDKAVSDLVELHQGNIDVTCGLLMKLPDQMEAFKTLVTEDPGKAAKIVAKGLKDFNNSVECCLYECADCMDDVYAHTIQKMSYKIDDCLGVILKELKKQNRLKIASNI